MQLQKLSNFIFTVTSLILSGFLQEADITFEIEMSKNYQLNLSIKMVTTLKIKKKIYQIM